MTESTRHLPGVKGQWILCSECPPTAEWADIGQVQVYSEGNPWGAKLLAVENVMPTIYWRPKTYIDTRPFALEPATTERRIVQLVVAHKLVYAVADDGTAWLRDAADNDWEKLAALPPREA